MTDSRSIHVSRNDPDLSSLYSLLPLPLQTFPQGSSQPVIKPAPSQADQGKWVTLRDNHKFTKKSRFKSQQHIRGSGGLRSQWGCFLWAVAVARALWTGNQETVGTLRGLCRRSVGIERVPPSV